MLFRSHETVFIKLPILVTVAAKPIAAIVVPFIRKADGDRIVAKGPQFLYEPIVQLSLPLAGQKRFDGFAALQELRTIAPTAVGRVGKSHARGIAGIPGILGQSYFQDRRFGVKGGKGGRLTLKLLRYGWRWIRTQNSEWLRSSENHDDKVGANAFVSAPDAEVNSSNIVK